jgi:2-dehydropantoate 2-reductase
MRIVVMGAGAIGSLIGGRLASTGNEVVLVGRNSLVDAVRSRGLTIEEPDHPPRSSNVEVVSSVGNISPGQGELDAAFVTVKVHDTRKATQDLLPALASRTPVVLVQNGVGGDEAASAVLGHQRLVSGVITLAVSSLEPGRVRQTTSRGGIGLAALSPDGSRAPLGSLLREAGFVVRWYSDYRAMKWSKLLLNIVGNASSAILDMPPSEVFANAGLLRLEISAFREALATMRALGLAPVFLPGYPVGTFAWAMRWLPVSYLRPIFRRLGGSGRGGKMPSLHIDLSASRSRSEVDYLNGAVVRAARTCGLSVPVNETLHSVLSGIVGGRIAWDEYRGRPGALLNRVQA